MSSISHGTQPKVYNKLCAKIQKKRKKEMIDVVCVKYSRDVSGCGRLRIEQKKKKKRKNGIKWPCAQWKSLVSPQQAHNTRHNKYYNRFPVAVFLLLFSESTDDI
jgi:deoxyribodipyrimidine photolyase